MTHLTLSVSLAVRQVSLCLLAAALLMDIGCVSQHAYEQIKAQTAEHTQALGMVREEITQLDEQIAGLQAINRQEDAVTGELRASIQREEELLPVMRQEADERLTALKGQVAGLLNQSWHLARKIADIRQESSSLQARAARYKHELEQAQAQASLLVASQSDAPSIAHHVAAEAPPAPALPPVEETNSEQVEAIAPVQVAQHIPPASSPTPVVLPPPPASSIEAEPPAADDSWIGMITGWLLAFWNWLFS